MWRIITRRAFSASPVTPRATQLLINGKFQPAVSGKTMDVYNPATERVIAQVAEGDAADVALAVDAARAAFDSGPWRKMSGTERGQLMYRLALFFNQGQCCIAGSRVYVHERIYDEFVARSVAAAKARKLGDPLDEKVDQGPQVDRDQMNKIMQYIDSGKQQGANLATGGHRWGKTGYYVEPTIFTECNDDMKIAREEIFGPVMSVFRFRTVDEVIRRANDSNYGLGAGVMTKNLETALKFANELRVGTVYVNCYDEFRANTPFGGYKDSGIGRELGLEGIKNYLELKTVIMRTAPGSLP